MNTNAKALLDHPPGWRIQRRRLPIMASNPPRHQQQLPLLEYIRGVCLRAFIHLSGARNDGRLNLAIDYHAWSANTHRRTCVFSSGIYICCWSSVIPRRHVDFHGTGARSRCSAEAEFLTWEFCGLDVVGDDLDV